MSAGLDHFKVGMEAPEVVAELVAIHPEIEFVKLQ